jgi:hypothetical protein
MDKDNVVYTQNGVLFSHKEKLNYVICKKMDRTGDDDVNQTQKDICPMSSLICGI